MVPKKKMLILVSAVLLFAVVWFGASLLNGSPSGEYEGRIFVAGEGGHIADASVVINPAAEEPIQIPKYLIWTGDKLHFIPTGESADHSLHDIRIDSQDPNTIFWSTYAAKKPAVIVGKADLRTDRWVTEKRFELPKEVRDFGETEIQTLYCGSGQTEKEFLPVFMGYPGFIDVIDKKTLNLNHRVMFASNPELPVNYRYAHGTTSPDNKYFFLAMNDSQAPFSKATGNQSFFIFDLPTLAEKGELKILKKSTMDFPKGTITFRSSFTPDGKFILQSARTKTLVLKADDLSLVQQAPIPEEWENHDIIATPDGRYGISTVRTPLTYEGAKVYDGQIWLYDIAKNQYLGKPTSTCRHCHEKFKKHAPLTWGLQIAGCTRCHEFERNTMHVLGDNFLCGADSLLIKK
ncbi:MAG: hypothetical protein ABSF90_16735 [Syntrophobacteraceae bacterium]